MRHTVKAERRTVGRIPGGMRSVRMAPQGQIQVRSLTVGSAECVEGGDAEPEKEFQGAFENSGSENP